MSEAIFFVRPGNLYFLTELFSCIDHIDCLACNWKLIETSNRPYEILRVRCFDVGWIILIDKLLKDSGRDWNKAKLGYPVEIGEMPI